MARDKKSMIGFDPLAWLADADEKADSQENEKIIETTNDEPVTQTLKSKKKSKPVLITVLGHSLDETALLKGYELATDALDEVVVDFYEQLFSQYPAVKPLFEHTNEKTQASKLLAALKLLVENLHNEDALQSTLSAMGERHQKYGALPDHYPIVAELLVASFKNKIGRPWTKAIGAAWMELLVAAAQTMCAAYKDEVVQINDESEPERELEALQMLDETPVVALIDSGHPVLQLNSIQDISKSQALKNDMLTLINDNDEIDIHASDVERIDGSALQLLCALFNYAKQNNLIINWIDPSDVLKDSAQTLGLQQILELNN